MEPITIVIIWTVILAVVFVNWRVNIRRLTIVNPRLGMLDLTAGGSNTIIEEDRTALGDLFSAVELSTNLVPKCDVLFLYATLGDAGLLVGTDRYLRMTIRESGAKIVVLASENPNPKPTKPSPGDAKANLVITLQRKGGKFTRFFRELFERMKSGQSMPMAWVQIAPQADTPQHDDLPGTICAMEAGALRLG